MSEKGKKEKRGEIKKSLWKNKLPEKLKTKLKRKDKIQSVSKNTIVVLF